jgi:acyl carrier protein
LPTRAPPGAADRAKPNDHFARWFLTGGAGRRAAIELAKSLGYTQAHAKDGGRGPGLLAGGCARSGAAAKNRQDFRGLPMSSTFDTVANIISETCDIDRDKITPESHSIDDLGIDSLDFLDIAFAIDKAFGIKLPLEQWTQEVNDGKATTEQYFVLKNLCARIDELVAAKGAAPA